MKGDETKRTERALALEDFAADVVEWPAVRAQLERHASSSLGKRALAELAPRSERGARDALERVAELSGESASARPPFAGVCDPLPALSAAEEFGRALSPEELLALNGFLRAVAALGAWLGERRGRLPACAALGAGLPDLSPLREKLDRLIDAKGEVRDDASPALARVRRESSSLNDRVESAVRRIAERAELRNVLAEGHVGRVQRRGGRPVVAVRSRSLGQVPGIVHDRSQSGETLFVEPREVVEDGNRLAVARLEEAQEIARLLSAVTRELLSHRAPIEAAAERVAELELADLGAAWAERVGGRPARVPPGPGVGPEDGPGDRPVEREGDPRGLLLRAFRHPLLIEQVEEGRIEGVTPIDLRLGHDFDLLVITGPNTGGKTLALKGAGLAALLTRLGFPLPCAEGTSVPLYDGVVADIGDEQEIRQNLSTFAAHLVRIRAALERAGPRTLVLLDELGGGTDPDEGAALGDAVLETLLERGAPTLASTHVGRLKHFAFRHRRAENACVEFDLETLAPRYHILLGAPGESRALHIARRLGVEESVVARAESRLVRRDPETERLMDDLVQTRRDAERLRSDAEARRERAQQELRELGQRTSELEVRERLVEAEAQRGLEERVRDARAWVERGRALLPQVSPAQRAGMEEVFEGLGRALEGAALSDRRRDFLEGLKKGALVYVPRFKKRCAVQRIDKVRKRVTVRLGRQELEVGFDEVTIYDSL